MAAMAALVKIYFELLFLKWEGQLTRNLVGSIRALTPSIKAYYDSYCASVDVMLNFTYRHYILYESIYEWILVKSTLYMNYYIECCMIFDMLVEK